MDPFIQDSITQYHTLRTDTRRPVKQELYTKALTQTHQCFKPPDLAYLLSVIYIVIPGLYNFSVYIYMYIIYNDTC